MAIDATMQSRIASGDSAVFVTTSAQCSLVNAASFRFCYESDASEGPDFELRKGRIRV